MPKMTLSGPPPENGTNTKVMTRQTCPISRAVRLRLR